MAWHPLPVPAAPRMLRGRPSGPLSQEKRAGPGLPLAMRAARNPRWRGHETHVEGKPVKNPYREMSRIK